VGPDVLPPLTPSLLWQTLHVHVAFDADLVKNFQTAERNDVEFVDMLEWKQLMQWPAAAQAVEP